jgi:hypothetical protein
MAPGISGRLITATFADTLLDTLPGSAPPPPHVARALGAWGHRRDTSTGPASSVRSIADVVVIPLMKLLGFTIAARTEREQRCVLTAAFAEFTLPVVVLSWDQPLDGGWRSLVLDAIGTDARWCMCCNGRALRIVDAQHTWRRDFLEFDLSALPDEPRAQEVLWSLARVDAFAAVPPVLDRAVELSARHGVTVCRALGDGVIEALAQLLAALSERRSPPPPDAFEQSLTVLYRVLFLLFAEARALVPLWHPVYRERYTIASIVDALLAGRTYRGVWRAILAISRLAHSGCSVGELKVTAFNGRLFAPSRVSAFERTGLDDDVMGRAVLALSTTVMPRGRARIAYRDLGVEQLGAVYEHVLDYTPADSAPTTLTRSRDVRKSTGTFYTPRALTDALVRRTLTPLIAGRTSREILTLRVLDPAMGSGAFLVAACRHLAQAAEEARIREGAWHPADVTASDRAELRREIALRCLFGVDLNPMAVQLGRLSIWLATLAADRPLTFLDHHVVCGDSLVGATPDDVQRQPSRGRVAGRRPAELPLFDDGGLAAVLGAAVRARVGLADEQDRTVDIVHRKELALAALRDRNTLLGAWRRLLDLWCAGWFWDDGVPPDAATFGEVRSHLLGRPSMLPERITAAFAGQGDTVADKRCFLHWPLAFPEIFCDDRGEPRPDAGFDAIIGNPPWDMVRGDSGDAGLRLDRRGDARMLGDFVREAGVYRVPAGAHLNRYQLFLERALQLTRRGGRIGLVLPAGVLVDSGTAALRRRLFTYADVDSVIGLDNRHRIFPIHRGVRFVVLTCTTGTPTVHTACRFGVTNVEALNTPDEKAGPPLVITRRLLSRLSGEDDLGIPDLASGRDLAIVEKLAATIPWLASPDGWGATFGRELNATDDRGAFVPFTGHPSCRPVLEGKQIEPFRVAVDRSRIELPSASRDSARVPRRARLAYRDVASATNRLTLIAAIIPATCVTTHTLSCLKTRLGLDAQHVLCALLNTYVANYLIRFRVSTHVTASLIARLPVPRPGDDDSRFTLLGDLSRRLAIGGSSVENSDDYADLQAHGADLYGLSTDEFEHVLSTFPLISTATKARVLSRHGDIR